MTDREQEGTSFATATIGVDEILETMVWDESLWDRSVWDRPPVTEAMVIGESRIGSSGIGDEGRTRLEAILGVIGSGAFPPRGKRDALNDGERRQLRDAMILDAHAREGRDVFVTKDEKAYVKHGRRETLEALCSTRIMTVDQFLDWLGRDEEG